MSRTPRLASTPLGTALGYLILILSVLLCAELLFFTMTGEPDSGLPTRPALRADLQEPIPLAPQKAYEELVRRTLFSPDRKPKVTVQQTAGATSGKVSEYWLLAGVVKHGVDSYAMFSEKQGQRHLKLTPGMSLDSWTVESIHADQVVLMKNGESDTLALLIREPLKKPKRVARKLSRPVSRARSGTTKNAVKSAKYKTRSRPSLPAEQSQDQDL